VFTDISFNFVVGEDGNIYEGRGWGVVGELAPNYSGRSIGICVIGDFTGEPFCTV
jgi:N-acetylmuramoyl-L-alanine amidase